MSVAKSSFIFSAGTFLSRISGLLRDSVVSAVFGASIYLDAYNIACRIPNLLRELLAEGALGASFTKVYSSLCVTSKDEAQKLLVQTLQLTVMVSIVVVSLGIIFSEQLVWLTTASQSVTDLDTLRSTANGLTKVIFPFIGFLSIGAIVQSVLYQRGRFFLPAVAPIVFNLANVLGALWLGKLCNLILPESVNSYFGNAAILGLTLGTLLGGALQAGVQLMGIWRPLLAGVSLIPKTIPWSKDTKKVVVLMGPMIIAASAGQINFIVNSNFATSLQTGTTTWIGNAFRMLQFPIGMFGVAIGSAVLPALSKSFTEAGGKCSDKVALEVTNALELVAWLMVPCSLLLYGNAFDITRVLFQAGRYTATDTSQTAIALQAYSFGLLGYGLLKVLNSYYYASDRTKFPMWVGIFSVGVNYYLNSVFVNSHGHMGLAMTASFILTLNALILAVGMFQDGFKLPTKRFLTGLGFLVVSSIIVLLARRGYEVYLQEVEVSSLVGLTGTLGVKFDSALRLALDAAFVVLVFMNLGLYRLGKSWKEALKLLRRRK